MDDIDHSPSEFFHRYVLWVLLGGFGAQIGLRVRAKAQARLGGLPPCWKWIAIDFESDVPRANAIGGGDESGARLRQAAYGPNELALLRTSNWNVERLAKRMDAGDPEVAWLTELVSPKLLRAYPGGEALAAPTIARAAAAYSAAFDAERSWLAMMRKALEELGGDGEARHATLQAGVAPEVVDAGATQVVFVGGSSGGCGRGLMVPTAATALSIGRRIGPLQNNAFVVYGPYRPIDGQESRKAALAYSLMKDFERTTMPDSMVRFPIGPGRVIETLGRLFECVGGLDASGRLRHDEHATANRAADALWFQYGTLQGFQLAKSRSNIRYRPRLLHNLEN